MANVNISPDMNLPIPVVGVDPGPDWANNINACLNIIDGHNHTPGDGVQITPAGLNINTDLTFNSNNATSLRSTRYTAQGSPLSGAADLGCVYVSGVDLYYNDENGNEIRITKSGSVTGAAGTITGLPSGTASASYNSGVFTFDQATNTPAQMNVGSVNVGQEVASGFAVLIQANGSQSSNYDLTLPLALPSVTSYLQSDTSGNLSFKSVTIGTLPIGSIIATFPSLTGAYTTTATTVADASGFVLCVGQTISDATSPMNGDVIPNINNFNFVRGSTVDNVSGGTGTQVLIVANLPSHTHTFTSSTSVASSSHTHTFAHIHQWGYANSADGLYAPSNRSFLSTASFTQSTSTKIYDDSLVLTQGSGATFSPALPINPFVTGWYTAGATDGSGTLNPQSGTPSSLTTVSGTTDATGAGTGFSIIPSNISSVYLMRIK